MTFRIMRTFANVSYLRSPIPENARQLIQSQNDLSLVEEDNLCRQRFLAAITYASDPRVEDLTFPHVNQASLFSAITRWVFPILIAWIVYYGFQLCSRLFSSKYSKESNSPPTEEQLIFINGRRKMDLWLSGALAAVGFAQFWVVSFSPDKNKYVIWGDANTLGISLLAAALLQCSTGLMQFWGNLQRVEGSYSSKEQFVSMRQISSAWVDSQQQHKRMWVIANLMLTAAMFALHIREFEDKRAIWLSIGGFLFAIGWLVNPICYLFSSDVANKELHYLSSGMQTQIGTPALLTAGALFMLFAFTSFTATDLPCGYVHLSNRSTQTWIWPFIVMLFAMASIVFWLWRLYLVRQEIRRENHTHATQETVETQRLTNSYTPNALVGKTSSLGGGAYRLV